VKYSFQSFRDVLGYAQTGYRLAYLLVVLWKANKRYDVKNGTYFASFGTYGGKWTIGALRIWKISWRRFYSRSTLHCTFGLRLMCTYCNLVLMTFSLAFLFLIRCFLCILSVYEGVPNAFLMTVKTQKLLSKDTKYEKTKLKYLPRTSLNPRNIYYLFPSINTKKGKSLPFSKSQHSSAVQTSTNKQTVRQHF